MTMPNEPAPRVLVVDADSALLGLLQEWLGAEGLQVEAAGDGCRPDLARPVDLVIVDMPFPRQGCRRQLDQVSLAHSSVPVLALSSSFVGHVECCGSLARDLGVTCVLPKPATRDALLNAVHRLQSAARPAGPDLPGR